MPRINKVIELWDAGQPIYHVGAGPLTYDNGVKQSQTWADYLEIDYYGESVKKGPEDSGAYIQLRIDDSSLDEADQTRIEALIL